MKVYLIVGVDSSGKQFIPGVCFDSKENAEKYCEDYNNDTYDYLEYSRINCIFPEDYNNDTYDYLEYPRINCIFPGDFSLFEVREIDVIEDEN